MASKRRVARRRRQSAARGAVKAASTRMAMATRSAGMVPSTGGDGESATDGGGGGAGPAGVAPRVPSLGEDEQRRAGLVTGWAGGWRAAGLAGPGDEQADPAGAVLVLDRLGDAE